MLNAIFLSAAAQINVSGNDYAALDCVNLGRQSGWLFNPSSHSLQCGDQKMSGPYSASAQLLAPLNNISAHSSVHVSFYLGILDTWNGESFVVEADDVEVFSNSYTTDMMPTSQEWSSTCNQAPYDHFEQISFAFTHNASSLNLNLTSTLQNSAGNWAVCGVEVYFNPCPTNTYSLNNTCLYSCPPGYFQNVNTGNCEVCDSTKCINNTISLFSCSNAQKNNQWKYTPNFATNNCGGSTYIGSYRKGAYLQSYYGFYNSHQSIVIQFNIVFIDTWNQQEIRVYADDQIVYRTKCKIDPDNEIQLCGDNTIADTTQAVEIRFNHYNPTLKLVIESTAIDDPTMGTWGICGLNITSRNCTISTLR